MKCYYCEIELIEDSFGVYCPNEKCHSIDGKTRPKETHKINNYWSYLDDNDLWDLIC